MKKLFVVLFGCLSFLFISGCGHSLSGTYESGDYRIEFSKNGSVKWVESATSLNGVYQYNDNGTYVINIDYGGMVVGYIVNEEDDGSLLVNGGFLSNKKFVKSGMTEEISKDVEVDTDEDEIKAKENENYGENKTLYDLTFEDVKHLFGGRHYRRKDNGSLGHFGNFNDDFDKKCQEGGYYLEWYEPNCSQKHTIFRIQRGNSVKNENTRGGGNRVKEGLWTLYDKDCNIVTQCEYRDGEPYNGLCIVDDKDYNSRNFLTLLKYYVNGETDGSFYEIDYFDFGEKCGDSINWIEFYNAKTGEREMRKYYKDPNQLESHGKRLRDEKNERRANIGERIYYDENGKVIKKEIYNDEGDVISEEEY